MHALEYLQFTNTLRLLQLAICHHSIPILEAPQEGLRMQTRIQSRLYEKRTAFSALRV